MVNASRVIQFLYPNAVPLVDYEVTQRDLWSDGVQGQRITFWNVGHLGPEPTLEELAAVEVSAGYLAWKLEQAKIPKYQAVSTLTSRRLAEGVLYNGRRFSVQLLNTLPNPDSSATTYPVLVNTSGGNRFAIADAVRLRDFITTLEKARQKTYEGEAKLIATVSGAPNEQILDLVI